MKVYYKKYLKKHFILLRLNKLNKAGRGFEVTPNSWTTNYWGSFMSKYIHDLKIIIANQCLAGETSRKLSKIYSISSRQIRYWRLKLLPFMAIIHSYQHPIFAVAMDQFLRSLSQHPIQGFESRSSALNGTIKLFFR